MLRQAVEKVSHLQLLRFAAEKPYDISNIHNCRTPSHTSSIYRHFNSSKFKEATDSMHIILIFLLWLLWNFSDLLLCILLWTFTQALLRLSILSNSQFLWIALQFYFFSILVFDMWMLVEIPFAVIFSFSLWLALYYTIPYIIELLNASEASSNAKFFQFFP